MEHDVHGSLHGAYSATCRGMCVGMCSERASGVHGVRVGVSTESA